MTADGQTTTQNVSMTYNDLGAINSLTYPDGETVTSNYDSNGRVRSAYLGTTASSDPVAFLSGQVSYINSGQLAGLAIGGTANKTSVPTPLFGTTLGYDGMQRLNSSSATRTGASSPFWSQQQTYDNAGNILHLSTTLPTVSGGSSKTDNQSFCYDALDRVTWAGNTGTPVGGDHCGATPTGSTTPGYSQPFSYDVLDRITQGSAGTVSYGDPTHIHAATGLSSLPNAYASYDVMGNMTCRNVDSSGSQSCASGTQTGATMSYDNMGRLMNWTAPIGLTQSEQYLYDNEGNRVLRRTNITTNGVTSTTDTITFDGLSEVSIMGSISTVTNYFSVAGQRVAMRKGAILSYLLPDFLGSDSIALKNDGSVQAVQLFAPYGSVRYGDQIMPMDYSFTGQRLDSMTGLLYYNARYYDSVCGMFTSADTVQNNTTGLDPYAYAADSPETRIDPTGNMFTQVDAGGGSPGVDDPTGLGQLFSDIQDYLNSQNPFVSGVEVAAAVETAPIWVPIVLVGLLLSIPSDSSQSNQSQNTSASPSPEATPATSSSGAGARVPNRPLSGDSETYLFNHLETILPGETYVDNGKQVDHNGRYTTSKSGGTDIDLETSTAVINVGTYSKFYNYGTTTINEKSVQKFYTAMGKYMKYAATVGKPVYFGYDVAWSTVDIPTNVQNWLTQKGIKVFRFSSH